MVGQAQSPILEQKFRLTQDDPVISAVQASAGLWGDLWTYQVPNGTSLILKPEHTFSLYLVKTGGSEASATTKVKIEKRDSTGSDRINVLGPGMYMLYKEFQDVNLMAMLSVPSSGIIVNERELLVISVWPEAGDTAVLTTSYFELRIAKVRKALAG